MKRYGRTEVLLVAFALALFAIGLSLSHCGYSEQEMNLARGRQQLLENQLEQCYERIPADDTDAGH